MIITRTPLRVSFLGGNTDFPKHFLKNDGFVVTSTIDKYIYCIVKKRFDDLIIVNYTQRESVEAVGDLKHDLVRSALALTGITKGIEISFLSDIPSEGSGLGSSGAVTVGVLNALHTYKGEYVSSKQLAEEAVKIELDILQKNIGVQDQYAVALGGLRGIMFSKKITSLSIDLVESVKEDLNNSLMMFYTGTTRSADLILSNLNIKKNKQFLIETKRIAYEGFERLLYSNLGDFGRLMDKYWKLKIQMNESVTNYQIDDMYSRAIKAGAIGGKVLGAGGGGFLLVLFPADKRAKVREALKEYKEMPFRFTDRGSEVIYNI